MSSYLHSCIICKVASKLKFQGWKWVASGVRKVVSYFQVIVSEINLLLSCPLF